MKRFLILIFAFMFAGCIDDPQDFTQVQRATSVSCVKYVQPSATGTSCSAWGSTTACGDIQDAIDAAEYAVTTGGESSCEIWIKEGTYSVYQSSILDYWSVEEDNIGFYGGFEGTESQTVEARNARAGDETILTGYNNTICSVNIIKVQASHIHFDRLKFTKGGYGGIPGTTGAAVLIADDNHNVSFESCYFTNNGLGTSGAAVYIGGNTYGIIFLRSVFDDNTAFAGAAIYASTSDDTYCDPYIDVWTGCPLIYDCQFYDNTSQFGGAIYLVPFNGIGGAKIINSSFEGNLATTESYSVMGGAIMLTGEDERYSYVEVKMWNCRFFQNQTIGIGSTSAYGGAIAMSCTGGASCDSYSGNNWLEITNSTFVDNTAANYCAWSDDADSFDIYLTNSVVWNLDCTPSNEISSMTQYTHSLGYRNALRSQWATVELDETTEPPYFANESSGNLNLTTSSPMIDKGNDSLAPTYDIVGNGRVDSIPGGIVSDLGCYEAQYLPQGSACTTGSQCYSGYCADGYCCNNPCAGTCISCSLSGSEGTCSYIPSGDPDEECSVCKECNGAGSCVVVGKYDDEPNGDCGTYSCTGRWPSCFTSCTTNDECDTWATCYRAACQ